MDRRRFLLTALAAVIGAPVGGGAQGADRVWRVGLLLGWRPPPEWIARSGIFFGPMRELGWVDGQNVVFEERAANERIELLPMLARELIASRVDVIVASTSTATRAAKEATATIPIVFAEVAQPVRRGFVASLTRPGGNITGLADLTLELMPKRLELLKELVPGATRVAVLLDPDYPPHVGQGVLDGSKRASSALGLRLETFEVRTSEDFDAAFARIRQSRAEGVTYIQTPLFFHQRAQIADLAIKHRLPLVAGLRPQAEAGALLSYNSNLRQMYRQVAMYVDRILRGAKPADLPVQEPATFELVINLKTAKAIGLTIPPSLLARADQVIE
jgi:ABC-type uncharacterized transport system substrate-binding protein